MSLLPDAPGMELLHSRDYEIKVYRTSEAELLVHGAVSDRKPPGLYVVGDPERIGSSKPLFASDKRHYVK